MSKIYVVIGGGSGIGRAVSDGLIASGNKVLIVRNNSEELNEFSDNKLIETYQCDTSKSGEVQELLTIILSKFGQIDGLVNCAGNSTIQSKGILDVNVFENLLRNNLTNAYIVTHLFGYDCIKDGGSIVNVSSIRGRTGTDSFSAGYAAAKAGVINITKTYAIELAEKRIRVNCVSPGLTYPTGLSKDWTLEFRENIAKTIPLKRLASPEEIAGAILFLLSDSASYITGQTIDINGGLWMN